MTTLNKLKIEIGEVKDTVFCVNFINISKQYQDIVYIKIDSEHNYENLDKFSLNTGLLLKEQLADKLSKSPKGLQIDLLLNQRFDTAFFVVGFVQSWCCERGIKLNVRDV